MKTQRILIALTVLNLGLLAFQLTQFGRAQAGAPQPADPAGPPAVLRGSGLEIVDDQGRVRASIKLHAADPSYKWPDGKTGYPETIMFRLIDGKGRPEVKIGASEKGGGLGLIGETDTTHAILQADGAETLLKLTAKDGKQHLIKP
jgi:hypothetical protein